MSETRRLVLFSGLGADERLFSRLNISGVDMLVPAYPDPAPGESLPVYAERLAGGLNIGAKDVIGGASFGGMVAAQIASRRTVAGLILLGSCLDPAAFPKGYAWLERLSRGLPVSLLKWRPLAGALLRSRFAPLSDEDAGCLLEMAVVAPPALLRRGGRMLMRWAGAPPPSCPVLTVHGALDRVIPAVNNRADVLLADAGHAFPLTHPGETSEAITTFLRAINPSQAMAR